MLTRAVIYGLEHGISILWLNQHGKSFSFKGELYAKDREAFTQVIEDENKISGIVESLYIEGDPIPLGSKMNPIDLLTEIMDESFSESTTKPHKGFWDTILRR